MAFLDGELPPAESQEVEKLIAGDATLSAYIERQRALKGALAEAFAPVLSEDIPSQILHSLKPVPLKPRLSFATVFGKESKLWFPVSAALASGAMIGVVITTSLSAPGLLRNEGGTLVAQGALADTLTSELANNTLNNTVARLGVTFRDHDGRFCRTFTSQGDSGAMTGIACRADTQWHVAALSAAEKSANGRFQPAAAALPESIRDTMGAMMAGAPLDADAERAARDSGWNSP
jgi:hypothetical protein